MKLTFTILLAFSLSCALERGGGSYMSPRERDLRNRCEVVLIRVKGEHQIQTEQLRNDYLSRIERAFQFEKEELVEDFERELRLMKSRHHRELQNACYMASLNKTL